MILIFIKSIISFNQDYVHLIDGRFYY